MGKDQRCDLPGAWGGVDMTKLLPKQSFYQFYPAFKGAKLIYAGETRNQEFIKVKVGNQKTPVVFSREWFKKKGWQR